MQRWNGWGDNAIHADLPPKAATLLCELIGEGNPGADYPLEKFLNQIPETRIPDHPMISIAPRERLDHAHGQSLPDWISMRMGTIRRFPDGVAFPPTPESLGEVLEFAEKHQIIVIPYGGGTSVAGHLSAGEGEGRYSASPLNG